MFENHSFSYYRERRMQRICIKILNLVFVLERVGQVIAQIYAKQTVINATINLMSVLD